MDNFPSNLYFIVTDHSIRDLNHKYTIIDGQVAEPEAIKNREIIQGIAKANHLCFLNQVHGNEVYYAQEPQPLGEEVAADAFYTDKAGILLCIRTADCCPIILYSDDGTIIGGAHAGWRGARANIVRNLHNKMSKYASEFSAIIGPTICQESYEVGQEFYDNFMQEDARFEDFFIASEKGYYFDLSSFVQKQLQELGISKIHKITEDTYTTKLPDGSYKYPSYRRHCHIGEDYPRSIITAIMIKP